MELRAYRVEQSPFTAALKHAHERPDLISRTDAHDGNRDE